MKGTGNIRPREFLEGLVLSSKVHFQGELHLSRRVRLAVNHTEVAAVDLDVRPTELRVVERVKCLDAEL